MIRVVNVFQNMAKGGGAESLWLNVLRRQDRARFDCSIVKLGDAAPEHDLSEFQVLDIKPKPSGRRFPVQVAFGLAFAREMRRRGVQIVQSHARSADRPALALAKLRGARILRTMHNVPKAAGRTGLGTRFMEHFTDHWAAVSPSAADYLKGCGVRPEKIATIVNGIDLDRFCGAAPEQVAATRASLGLAPGTILCLAVGRLFPQKNYPLLLRALDAARRLGCRPASRRSDLRLFIAGEGPERAAIEALIRKLDLGGQATLLGLRDDIPNLLRAADLFVMASHYEGLGCAAIEAMAASKPVIATNVEGLRDVVVSGRTGMLVPAGDTEAMALEIGRLATDAGLRARMGREGRKRAEEVFSLESMVHAYEALYEHLAAGRRI
jgi:glycosyltransferase involved in cell wall biosynthesis